MARVAGVNIPDRKHTVIALTTIFGIGRTKARAICAASGIDEHAKVIDLTEAEIIFLHDEDVIA